MLMRTQVVFIAAAMLALTGCERKVAPTQPDPESLTVRGIVADGELKDGKIWFDLSQMDLRFVLKADEKSADTIFAALKDSNKTGASITVTFGFEDVFIERESRRPTFMVRALKHGERDLSGVQSYRPLRALETSEFEYMLARGVALYQANRYGESRAKLDRCIAARGLAYDLKALAYKTRGYAYADEIGAARSAPDDAGDKQLLKALDDFNAWAQIEPDEPQAARAIAGVLTLLGAYDEALTEYARIEKRWPDQQYRVSIRVGAIYRELGDHARALRSLDDLVKTNGPQSGMMFHYHRGWTLTELKRYDEAVSELSKGLEEQPDYAWALLKRACALGQLGRVQEALDDQTRGVELFRGHPPELMTDRFSQAAMTRAIAVADELRAVVATAPTAPTSIPCDGYPTSWRETGRTRSKWLPKGAR